MLPRPRTPYLRSRSLATVVVTAFGCTLALNLPTAAAEPSGAQLKAQANRLRLELDRLSLEQDLAVEQFNESREAVRVATAHEVTANTSLIDNKIVAVAAQDRSARRVRALYQTGGPLALTSTILGSKSLDDAAIRWHTVESLIQTDADQVLAQESSIQNELRQVQQVTLSRAQVIARQQTAEQNADRVRASLARRRILLAQTDAAVLRLAEEQRRLAEARELDRAVAAARDLGLGSGQGGAGVTDALGRGLEGASSASQELPKVSAPNGVAAAAIQAAHSKLGSPYVWGAVGPATFDCSGLMMWAYAQAGVSIPRTSRAQYAGLDQIPLTAILPGDLIFYATNTSNPSSIYHVGMYIGSGLSLYAPRTGSFVKIGPVGYGRIIGAARPTGTS